MDNNTREVRISSMSKDVVVCVQDMVDNNGFLVRFKYGHSMDMNYFSLSYVFYE